MEVPQITKKCADICAGASKPTANKRLDKNSASRSRSTYKVES